MFWKLFGVEIIHGKLTLPSKADHPFRCLRMVQLEIPIGMASLQHLFQRFWYQHKDKLDNEPRQHLFRRRYCVQQRNSMVLVVRGSPVLAIGMDDHPGRALSILVPFQTRALRTWLFWFHKADWIFVVKRPYYFRRTYTLDTVKGWVKPVPFVMVLLQENLWFVAAGFLSESRTSQRTRICGSHRNGSGNIRTGFK